ncbi:Hsp70 family heat shock protein chaperone [Fusarium mexicanum]|uniref:Hsp70 family heat shock protein chaperone n=1 Tax=Fusarium mexicanum TaxID=751941 RepID=A0A8H5MZ22_9HYPO|nr:Hsp70 family heat shock protein chaperone [Fusarium mexicanum]
MVIAIDLGNIYSGVAWAFDNNEPKFVTGWETRSGTPSTEVNVPSALYYGGSNNYDNPEWGFKVPHDPEVLTWRAIQASHRCRQGSPHLAKVKQIMRKLGKKSFEIVGDYLRKLWSHSWDYICQSEGLEHQSAFNVVLCILSPVTWPSDTRVEITNALRHAGVLHDITRERFPLRFLTDFSTAVFAWCRRCRLILCYLAYPVHGD